MKTIELFSFFTLFIFLYSCGETENRNTEMEQEDMITTQKVPDADEAIKGWENAWNSKDPEQVRAMTADDVVLVLNGQEFPQDSLGAWIDAATLAMQDLKLRSLKKETTDYVAYETGTYVHTYTDDTTHYAGSYTFIWERSDEENDWKVKVMNIAEVQAEGSMRE
ncbi:nuclear transport factor 2 family protein [Gillisia sp. Q332]|uniref:nuclear transport factor 2 family protein n=1 Tax=Gillisia xinjiangensis TaxID=3384765 RepID=UPI003919C130